MEALPAERWIFSVTSGDNPNCRAGEKWLSKAAKPERLRFRLISHQYFTWKVISAVPRRYVFGIKFSWTLVVLLMALQPLTLYTKEHRLPQWCRQLPLQSMWLSVPIKLICQKAGNTYYPMEWDGSQNVARLNSMNMKLVGLMLEQGEAP